MIKLEKLCFILLFNLGWSAGLCDGGVGADSGGDAAGATTGVDACGGGVMGGAGLRRFGELVGGVCVSGMFSAAAGDMCAADVTTTWLLHESGGGDRGSSRWPDSITTADGPVENSGASI